MYSSLSEIGISFLVLFQTSSISVTSSLECPICNHALASDIVQLLRCPTSAPFCNKYSTHGSSFLLDTYCLAIDVFTVRYSLSDNLCNSS